MAESEPRQVQLFITRESAGGGVVGMSLREFDGTPWRVVSQAPSGVQPGQGFLEVWTFEEPDQGGAVRNKQSS